MSDVTLDALLAQLPLGEQSTATLSGLPAPDQARLVQILQQAVARKDERINGAVNNALSVVPLPLRGTVKKMLFS